MSKKAKMLALYIFAAALGAVLLFGGVILWVVDIPLLDLTGLPISLHGFRRQDIVVGVIIVGAIIFGGFSKLLKRK